MTSPEASADEQGSFSPNVAADLVRSSINNGESIRGMVNGQVFGGSAASSIDSVSLAKNEKKQRSTVAEKWSIQNLLATALGKADPSTWKTSYQQPGSGQRVQREGSDSQSSSFSGNNSPHAAGFAPQGLGGAVPAGGTGQGSPRQGAAAYSSGVSGNSNRTNGRNPAQSLGNGLPPAASQPLGNKDVMRHGLIKVPVAPRDPDGRENIYRRVAKFLLLIGTDEAAKVISHLSPAQTEQIIPEIASIRRVDPDEAAIILEEFKSLLENARQQGGVTTARNILEKAFGPDRAEEFISKAVPFPEGVPFDYLQEMDGQRVFLLLKDEPPPVQTLVLSRLKPAVAAEVINQLENDQKKEVIRRLAKLTPMDPEILRRVDRAMHDKVLMMNTSAADSMDGRGALTEILKRMSPTAEKDILTSLAQQDPELSNDIRERLFTIDDIIMADDRFLQKKLHAMTEGEIALLIAGKPESFRQKILTNVSKNRGDIILEEEVLRRPMRRRDCDEVTARFFSVLRRAWEDGSLIIQGRSDDIYV